MDKIARRERIISRIEMIIKRKTEWEKHKKKTLELLKQLGRK